MSYENLSTKVEDGIGWVINNRPDKLNALNTQTVKEIRSAFLELKENPEVNAVILTGSGEKAFLEKKKANFQG